MDSMERSRGMLDKTQQFLIEFFIAHVVESLDY
jgi:hypothetical protein